MTLDLAVDARGPGGQPAPAGLFTAAPATLTIPAGGQAQTTVTTNPAIDNPHGVYGGVIRTSGGAQLRTPIAVTRDAESYEVTLSFFDRDGKPAPAYSAVLANVTQQKTYSPFNSSGTAVVRVPQGRYAALGFIGDIFDDELTFWAEPELTVNGPTTLTIDARDAKPVEYRVAQATPEKIYEYIRLVRPTDWGGIAPTPTAASARPGTTAIVCGS